MGGSEVPEGIQLVNRRYLAQCWGVGNEQGRGACSLVNRDIPANVVAFGVSAKVVKPLRGEGTA